jgi:hypothetical protein
MWPSPYLDAYGEEVTAAYTSTEKPLSMNPEEHCI